ncbi:hypothetical protein Tco_0298763 [Tanacetum coccineum]
MIMVKLSVDLNEPKDNSKTDKAAQNGRTPKSLTLEIHHGWWFTPTPSRSYIGRQVSSVNVVDIDEFCLHDLKDMLSVNLNEPKDSSKTCKAAQNGRTSKSLTMEIHHGRWFTPTPSRSYIGGQVSPVNVVDIDELCLHDLKDMLSVDLNEPKDSSKTDKASDDTLNMDTSIGGVDVQDDDLDVIDYDSFGSDLDDGIDSERRMQLRELRRIGKQKNKGPNKYYFYLGQQFASRAKCDLLINNICEVFNRQLVDGRDQPIITCLEYIREYLMKRIVVVQKVIAKTVGPLTPSVTKMKWELTGIPCKHVVAAIYNMSENSMGVGIPEQWVHAAYRLETWAHVYSFKVNPCNGRDMWPVVESRTVIIPPLYKPPIGRPPKKRKKSNDEIASQSASSGKLSRKGKSVSYGKCGNVGHNRKGCRGQGGGSSQAGARKVSGQAAGATNVSGQAAGARKVSGQAAGATNVSGQAAGARMVFGQASGAKKVSSQVADARKASSQPNAVQNISKQGPMQGFQGPIAGPASGS